MSLNYWPPLEKHKQLTIVPQEFSDAKVLSHIVFVWSILYFYKSLCIKVLEWWLCYIKAPCWFHLARGGFIYVILGKSHFLKSFFWEKHVNSLRTESEFGYVVLCAIGHL